MEHIFLGRSSLATQGRVYTRKRGNPRRKGDSGQSVEVATVMVEIKGATCINNMCLVSPTAPFCATVSVRRYPFESYRVPNNCLML